MTAKLYSFTQENKGMQEWGPGLQSTSQGQELLIFSLRLLVADGLLLPEKIRN